MVSFSEYEYLTNLEEMFEYYEIDEMLKTRMKKYNPNESVEWDQIKDQYMDYKILFIPDAVKDYKELDGSIKKSVDKKIEELKTNPFLGDKLGNKFNIDLTGFYKIYVHGKKYRIVYRIITPEKIEILEVWGIGKREKEEIYRTIGKRINEEGLI